MARSISVICLFLAIASLLLFGYLCPDRFCTSAGSALSIAAVSSRYQTWNKMSLQQHVSPAVAAVAIARPLTQNIGHIGHATQLNISSQNQSHTSNVSLLNADDLERARQLVFSALQSNAATIVSSNSNGTVEVDVRVNNKSLTVVNESKTSQKKQLCPLTPPRLGELHSLM